LWAVAIRASSARTASRPRSRNRLLMRVLICPKTGSTVAARRR
jgi:hypothetical protein